MGPAGSSPGGVGRPARTLQGTTFAFTAEEEAIAASERRWPMTIHLEALLDGELDPADLTSAVRRAMAIHPMACVRRRPVGLLDRRFVWEVVDPWAVDPVRPAAEPRAEAAAEPVERLEPEGPDAPLRRDATPAPEAPSVDDEISSTRLDLDDGPPFVVVARRRGEQGWAVSLVAHHAAFDGVGAVTLLAEVLDEWVHGRRHDDARRPVTDPYGELARRAAPDVDPTPGPGTADRPPPPSASAGHGQRRTGRPAQSIGAATSAVLAPAHPNRVLPSDDYRVLTTVVGRTETDALRHGLCAQAPGATLNDVLVAALHEAVGEWNVDHDAATGRITVVVPVSLRTSGERNRMVLNLTGQVTTESSKADRADRARLLQRVVARTQAAKGASDAGLAPAEQLVAKVGRLPVRVRSVAPKVVSALTGDRMLPTTRLSNLGRTVLDESPLGDVAVEHLWFLPPVRLPQGVNVGVVVHDGALHLGFRGCREEWTAEDLRALSDRYLEVLARFR